MGGVVHPMVHLWGVVCPGGGLFHGPPQWVRMQTPAPGQRPPGQRPPLDRDPPPDRDPLWKETPSLWKEAPPSGMRPLERTWDQTRSGTIHQHTFQKEHGTRHEVKSCTHNPGIDI